MEEKISEIVEVSIPKEEAKIEEDENETQQIVEEQSEDENKELDAEPET